MITTVKIVRIQVFPAAKENAAPELWTSLSDSHCPIRGMGSEASRTARAHIFDA